MNLLWVCIGGAIGSGARYLVAQAFALSTLHGLPWATFTVNALGSFLFSFITGLGLSSQGLKLFLTTGMMGGFTTYSTFNNETLKLFQSGAWRSGVLNIFCTLMICLTMGVLGLFLGERIGR